MRFVTSSFSTVFIAVVVTLVTVLLLNNNNSNNNGSFIVSAQNPLSHEKMAMTWALIAVQKLNGTTYGLFSANSLSNPYNGDTLVSKRRSLLCIKKGSAKEFPNPGNLLIPSPQETDGGATIYSWSQGRVLIIPNVVGNTLLSLTDANNKCNNVGKIIHNVTGFRMAEFHDGTDSNAAWSFWAEAYSIVSGLNAMPQKITPGSSDARYWVSINDQSSNPWY